MNHLSADLQACIDECLRCYQTCLGTAMGYCLEQGGRHVAPEHFRLMMACAEICRAAVCGEATHTSRSPFAMRVSTKPGCTSVTTTGSFNFLKRYLTPWR